MHASEAKDSDCQGQYGCYPSNNFPYSSFRSSLNYGHQLQIPNHLLPSILKRPPTPNQLPLLRHHQPRLLTLLFLNCSLQIRIIPREMPKRILNHLPHTIDPRVIIRSDIRFGVLGLRAGAGSAGEGKGRGGRIGRAVWEVRDWAF